ncbi:MAG: hypothetical protein ABS88_10645 [Sphingopyxis sp. SCN 67-31]|nr:MAG: hypothetical protein ABS88_10645 [Sphingopyxis sp. SCN 67-31]
MQRAALNRSNPSPRLVTIAAAAARRQAAAVPAIVEAEVGNVAGDLSALASEVTTEINSLKNRVYNLENPEP